MISVLHTFGFDMKYHVHVHSLITFGGLVNGGKWCWPRQKKKLAPFRLMSSRFREVFMRNVQRLINKKKIKVGFNWSGLGKTLHGKRWNVRTLYPAMNTGLIEEYLARYINRVAISPSRLIYHQREKEVQIIYNDYRKQEQGKAAPKGNEILTPIGSDPSNGEPCFTTIFSKSSLLWIACQCHV